MILQPLSYNIIKINKYYGFKENTRQKLGNQVIDILSHYDRRDRRNRTAIKVANHGQDYAPLSARQSIHALDVEGEI